MALPWTTRALTAFEATRGGKSVYHPKLPQFGSPSRAISRPVVKTTTRWKAREDSIECWKPRPTSQATSQEPRLVVLTTDHEAQSWCLGVGCPSMNDDCKKKSLRVRLVVINVRALRVKIV
uniref:Uncharacterized protein n=1 Tax=Solanum tuberosum TaxID=4113 RepID=M1DPP2_SOLTU